MDGTEWEELATGLAKMARTLLAQETIQDTLDQVVDHTAQLVEGCDDAGILTVEGRRGTVRTLAATSATPTRPRGNCRKAPASTPPAAPTRCSASAT